MRLDTLTAWLHVPGISDPVDRRNASMLQVALLALGIMPPALWLYRIAATGIPWRPYETVSLTISLLISVLALWSVVLIRRNKFQRAIRQLMIVVALLTIVSHALNGLAAHIFEMPVQLLWLFIAGMMIGRRALWAMFSALALALLLGAMAEVRMGQSILQHALGDAVIRSIMFLMITLVIDRSVAALRESLAEAVLRGKQLEQANAQLQAEMLAREQAQAQLLQAQKMEAVGRMASGLAHDFGHLLTLIDGYAGQAQRATSQEQLAPALDGVHSAAQRAKAQVAKLMHFARKEVPVIETFDATEALQDIAPMLRQTLGGAIQFRFEPPIGPASIRADREQFALVLLNIAANAADAMPDGGRFTLSATPDDTRDVLDIHLSDNGPGIPDAARTRVFEPFYTTKPLNQGTGLGLAVSHDLARSWGGQLDLAAANDAQTPGAVFRLTLPLAR